MAMSVVEAMQLGLVPVVAPVGEIRRYCRSAVNAVVVGDTDEAVAEVLRLLADANAWRALREGALATWRDGPLYADAVAAQCRRLAPVQGP
jgi:glycosyltransferase involved in cell wall biosynthesis